jgi:hypothetical protein
MSRSPQTVMIDRHRIELVFDQDCPHLSEARALLRTALAAAGLPEEWREWDRAALDTPSELRGFGSPTILVAGADVTGDDAHHGGADRCRVYPDAAGGLHGAPPLDAVIAALENRAR